MSSAGKWTNIGSQGIYFPRENELRDTKLGATCHLQGKRQSTGIVWGRGIILADNEREKVDIFSKKLWEKEQTQVRELKGKWFQKSDPKDGCKCLRKSQIGCSVLQRSWISKPLKKAWIVVNILCTQQFQFKEKLIIFLISPFYILYIL